MDWASGTINPMAFFLARLFPLVYGTRPPGPCWEVPSSRPLPSLKASLDPDGGWRVNAVAPVFLAPGLYRIGALMPVSGANQMIVFQSTYQTGAGISLTRFMRQIGSTTLAMPDLNMNSPDDVNFGPAFTYTPGPWVLPQPTVVAPNNYTLIGGNGGLNTLVRSTNAPRTYQMQFAAAALGGLPVGARITELRFRLYTNAAAAFPTNTVTWSDYEITLAKAATNISSMSATFSANMTSPVLVKHGPLSIGPNTFGTGPLPNPFGSFVIFDTPYVYQGGDLVMLFTHPGSDSVNTAFLDAVPTTSTDYGTTCRAISATTFNATSGAAASATIVQIVFTPSISATISRAGTNVIIFGMGGLSGEKYAILTATNPALPKSQWTPLTTNLFDSGGNFSYTNAIKMNLPVQLFRTVLP